MKLFILLITVLLSFNTLAASCKLPSRIDAEDELLKFKDRNTKYEENPKHTTQRRAGANPAPKNPDVLLQESYKLTNNTTRRIAVDKRNGEFAIFDEHTSGHYHGHSRTWAELDQPMRNILLKLGLVNRKGKIL